MVQTVAEQKKKGIRLWSREIPGTPRCLTLASDHHEVVVGSQEGDVHFFDSKGDLTWEANVGPPVTAVGVLPLRKRVVILDEYSHLTGIDFAGKKKFQKNFNVYWTSFEIKSGNLILWGWKSAPVKVNASGKVVQEFKIPHPWRRLRAVPKKDRFWVVHNQVCMGLYNAQGTNLWLVNNPSPIDLSRTSPSDLEVSDKGDVLAVSCHEKGVFIYNGNEHTLHQMDLEKIVTHVAVSGNGKFLLLSDALQKVYLVTQDAHVLWEKKLDSNAEMIRIDRKGDRVLVLEENGILSCFRFTGEEDDRSNFLELTDFNQVADKKNLWDLPSPVLNRSQNVRVEVADDGRTVLCGGGKDFQMYDLSGQMIWNKSFMAVLTHCRVTPGGKVFLWSSNELYFHDGANGLEKHLAFYQAPLRECAVDPAGDGFLIFDAGHHLALHDAAGQKLWDRPLKKKLQKFQLDVSGKLAVFQGAPRAVYLLNLKTLKAKHTVLGGPVRVLRISRQSVYVGGEGGRCHALDPNAGIRWKFQLDAPIQDIVLLDHRVAFVTQKGRAVLVEENGRRVGEFPLQSAHSVLTWHGEDILELVPRKDGINCYKVPSRELLWKLPLGGLVQALAVSDGNNRLAVLDSKKLHFFQLIQEQDGMEDRTHFLEL